MKKTYTRRDSLKLMGSAVIGSQVVGGAQPLAAQAAQADRAGVAGRGAIAAAKNLRAAEDMRGIFVILSTPYTESGAIHYSALAFQVEGLGHAGAHRLGWPQHSRD